MVGGKFLVTDVGSIVDAFGAFTPLALARYVSSTIFIHFHYFPSRKKSCIIPTTPSSEVIYLSTFNSAAEARERHRCWNMSWSTNVGKIYAGYLPSYEFFTSGILCFLANAIALFFVTSSNGLDDDFWMRYATDPKVSS